MPVHAALVLVVLTCSTCVRSASIIDIGNSGTWTLDLSQEPLQQAAVESSSYIELAQGGYRQSVDVSGTSTYGDSLVGLWSFNSLAAGTSLQSSSNISTVIKRGTVPCALPVDSSGATPACPDAWISGSGAADVPGLVQGKFGQGLNIAPGVLNWGQIFSAPLLQNAPGTSGYSIGAWIKLTSAVQGRVWERMFDNMDLNVWPDTVECKMNNNINYRATWYPVNVGTELLNTWHHFMCTYDPAGKLVLYVDGIQRGVANTSAATGFKSFTHADYQPISIFRRAGSTNNLAQYASPSDTLTAVVDDFAIWRRPLTASEAAALAVSANELAVRPAVSFTSANLIRSGTPREAGAVRVDWTASPADAITVQISTDNGRGWCDVSSSQPITDFLHAPGQGQLCLFPTVSLKLVVRWKANATLTALSVTFLEQHPSAYPRPSVQVGMNLGGVSYYGSQMPFNDLFQGCSGSGAAYPPQAGEDANGFPTAISPSGDQCLDGATTNYLGETCSGLYWVPGRYHFLSSTNVKQLGTYTAVVKGLGTFSLHYDAPAGTFTLPTSQTKLQDGIYVTYIDVQVTQNTDTGIMLLIRAQNSSYPITSFEFYSPGCCNVAAATCNSTCLSTFHPGYLKTVSGFKGIRTMDWQKTNGANLVNWSDRGTPSMISQDRNIIRMANIQSISCWSGSPPAFFQGQPAAIATTIQPHNLTTGQIIDVVGTSGGYTTTGSTTQNSFDRTDVLVWVVDANRFAYSLATWSWSGDPAISVCSAGGAAGRAKVQIGTGIAHEHTAELAGMLSLDPWVCVPHAATDDFVRSMAAWWAANLPAGRKLYVEYSNEVWNWMFSQTSFASRMAWQEGLASATLNNGDGHLRWLAKRAAFVFKEFKAAFTARGLQQTTVVAVMAVQAGSGELQLQQLRDVYNQPADALAIAPYFGYSLNTAVYALGANATVDQVLDLARERVVKDTYQNTLASAIIAAKYGVQLVAYEGGQHMGGGGSICGSSSCENVQWLANLFMSANRDPRMAGLYDSMFRAWSMAAGSNAGIFMAFSHIGQNSKWGSWGALEWQDQDPSTAPKYTALRQYAPPGEWQPPATPSPSPAPASSPSPQPSSPSPQPSSPSPQPSSPSPAPRASPSPAPKSSPSPAPRASPSPAPKTLKVNVAMTKTLSSSKYTCTARVYVKDTVTQKDLASVKVNGNWTRIPNGGSGGWPYTATATTAKYTTSGVSLTYAVFNSKALISTTATKCTFTVSSLTGTGAAGYMFDRSQSVLSASEQW